MAIARWKPRQTSTKAEEWIMRRLGRTRKLFAFLRAHRHALFDDAFQGEWESRYRDTGADKPPVPPARLARVTLWPAYLKVSEAEAVELSVRDRRGQLVLDCGDATAPPFSQGALEEFRARLIRTDMDRRRLERTVEGARQSKAFDARQRPKTVRVAFAARALEGAGRGEDRHLQSGGPCRAQAGGGRGGGAGLVGGRGGPAGRESRGVGSQSQGRTGRGVD